MPKIIDDFWNEEFGYGIAELTQAEAGHLRASKTFDEIRDRILKARYEGVSKINEEVDIAKTSIAKIEKRKLEPPEPEISYY